MSNLSSFAELIKEAAEDKKRRKLVEDNRKNKEVVPLLAELFSAVAKAKAPIEPEPVKPVVKVKKPATVEITTPPKEVEVESKVKVPESEPKLLNLFNRLQADFQTLKKYVESKSGSYSGGSGGSGEVRILRMDDVVKETPVDGSVMTWDSTLNKFKFILPSATVVGPIPIPEEEMPFSKRTDFVTDNELYKGEAAVGSSESGPIWRIRKLTIGLDGDVTEIYANGSGDYMHKWSERLTYTYS